MDSQCCKRYLNNKEANSIQNSFFVNHNNEDLTTNNYIYAGKR